MQRISEQVNVRMPRRYFLGGAIGVGATLALAACGGTTTPPGYGSAPKTPSAAATTYSGPNVTVSFWCGWTGADGDVAKKMIDDFNSSTSNVKVNMNVMKWSDFFTKLPAAAGTADGPDIAVMHIDDIPTQAAQQVIVPLDSVAAALGLKESDFAPAVWKGGLYQNKRYGIPIDVHDLGLYYNQSVMQTAGLDPSKPPTNESEYLGALEAMKAKGIQGSWVSPFQFTGGFMFQSLLWQFGGDLYDSAVANATWASDAGTKALTWMVQLISKGYSPANVAQDADYIALKNAKNAFNWQGIWQVNDATQLTTTKIATAALPKIGPQGGVWGNSHQFVLPRVAKGQDPNRALAAQYFVEWFTEHEVDWAASAKVPASLTLAKSAEFAKLTQLKAFADEVPDVHFPPSVAGIGDATAKLYDAIQAAVLGKQSVAEALSTSAQQATQILAANQKKYGA